MDVLEGLKMKRSLLFPLLFLYACGGEGGKKIDSTFVRLDRPFREKEGSFDKTTYKNNLVIVECVVKGVSPGALCSYTEVGDLSCQIAMKEVQVACPS